MSSPHPQWAPPSGPPARPSTRRSRGLIVALVGLVGIGTLVASMLAAAPAPPPAGGTAVDLIGADGHVEVLTDGADYHQDEWAHLDGSRAFSGPFDFYRVMTEQRPLEEAILKTWIRRTRTSVLGDQTHWLYSVEADGLRSYVEVPDGDPMSFEPGLLEVPADVRAGHEWDSTGTASTDRAQAPYSSHGRASAADDHGAGCLLIEHTDDLGSIGTRDRSAVWCPGRGMVTDGDLMPGTVDLPPHSAPEIAWQPEGWQLHQPEPFQVDNGVPLSVEPVGAPLGPSGRSLALSTSNDVVSFDDRWLLRGVAHSGGKLTAVLETGGLTLTAGSLRTITATDPRQWRRWQVPTDDVVVLMLPVDADLFLSVTSSGTIGLRELATGEVVWERTFPGAADYGVTTDAGRVFVASGRGEAAVLDLANGDTVTEVEVPDLVVAVGGRADLLVVYGDTGRVWAFDTDGTQRWTVNARLDVSTGRILVADREVVVGDKSGAVALAADDGRVLWSVTDPIKALVTDGDVVVLFDQTHLSVYREGRQLHRWTFPEVYLTSEFWCRPLTDGVTCIDGMGRITEARP